MSTFYLSYNLSCIKSRIDIPVVQQAHEELFSSYVKGELGAEDADDPTPTGDDALRWKVRTVRTSIFRGNAFRVSI